MIDPFSDEADPPRLDGTPAPDLAIGQLARRSFVAGLSLLPLALAAPGCVRPSSACAAHAAAPHCCTHQFCRYYVR
jgi:hypothetical protein